MYGNQIEILHRYKYVENQAYCGGKFYPSKSASGNFSIFCMSTWRYQYILVSLVTLVQIRHYQFHFYIVNCFYFHYTSISNMSALGFNSVDTSGIFQLFTELQKLQVMKLN